MPRYVAFLRAINVGGAHTVKMDALRRAFESLGFSDVTSFIASGNILFETPSRNATQLEDRIEAGLMRAFAYDIVPFVRTGAELKRIAAFRPFPKSSVGAGEELGIIFLTSVPGAKVKQALKASQAQAEEFRTGGREIYWLRHQKGAGVYSTLALDKVIDGPFTIRSIRTVTKIAAKYFP